MPTFMKAQVPRASTRATRSGGSGPGIAASLPPDAERGILSRLLAGRHDAREEFVRGYSGMALALARRIVREESVAREVVKDSMLKALSAVPSAPKSGSLSAWVRHIVVGAAAARRNTGGGLEAGIEDLLPTFDAEGHFAGRAAALAGTAGQAALLEAAPARVRECIGRLPEDYRMVLVLREFEELDTNQTAKVLEIAPSEVRARLHWARLALVGLLAGAVGDLGLGSHAVEAP